MSKLQVAYKFKLQPNQEQSAKLEDWQHKIGYIQNPFLGDRIAAYNDTFVEGDYCDLFTKKLITQENLYCDVETRALVSPFHCSVNKSASLGQPWKIDNPALHRARTR